MHFTMRFNSKGDQNLLSGFQPIYAKLVLRRLFVSLKSNHSIPPSTQRHSTEHSMMAASTDNATVKSIPPEPTTVETFIAGTE